MTGLRESELNLQVALKLRDELVRRGYAVVLTRENEDTAVSCAERAQIANKAQADAFLRIHANDGGGSGAQTICTTSSNPYTKSVWKNSSRLSEDILDTYCRVTGIRRQYIWYTDQMTGNNWAGVPTTMIEMGFLSNAGEDRWMASAEGQKKIVKGLADGLDRYFS